VIKECGPSWGLSSLVVDELLTLQETAEANALSTRATAAAEGGVVERYALADPPSMNRV
jgi:hypothetical protein